LGIGDWGLGIGPNPQSPIPNPHAFLKKFFLNLVHIYIIFNLKFIYIKYNMSNENNQKDNTDLLLDVLNSFRTKILTIRKMCEGAADFKQNEANLLLNEGLYDLIEIKNLNAKIQINCENKKEEYEQVKDNVGKDNLNLQKYEYHLNLIKNDINTNKQLPFFPESEKVKKEDEIKDDNSKLDEAFKNLLLGRKRLNSKLNELKEEKKKNENELKYQQNYLKDIPKYLDSIEKEVNKTKKLFNNCKNQKSNK